MKRSPGGGAIAASEVPHHIDIEGQRISVTLRRSSRRSFALQVDHRGVRVSVPLRASVAEVNHFVRGHGAWLLDRLRRAQRGARVPVLEPVDGLELPFLGRRLTLRLGEVGRAQWRSAVDGDEELHLSARGDAVRALHRALLARALDWYRGRVEEYCLRLGLPVPELRLSNARTRWGSCSSRSGIRLHWRLIHLPPDLIDYVVAHEVAHLREMNHSARFWAVVESVYPNWRAARARLREIAHTLPVIGAMTEVDVGFIDSED